MAPDTSLQHRPLNVLWLIDHVCYDGSLHGGGRLFMNLMPEFDEHRVKIFPYFLRASREVREVFAAAGHPAKTLNLGKFDPLSPFKLNSLCRQHDIDVMHLFCYAASTFGRMVGVAKGIPTVIHDFDTQVYYPYPPYLKVLDRLLAKSTGHALAASAMCKDYMRDVRKVPGDRIEVLFHAIPQSQLQTQSQLDRGKARAELGLSDEPVFCAVTKLGPERGNETLLAAFAEVLQREPRAKLFIVYKPTLYHRLPKEYDGIDWVRSPQEMRARVEREIARLGVGSAVRMIESLERPELFYAACDVMVAPFENVRFSSVNLVEGMAYGRPHVVTAIGEPLDLVERYNGGRAVPVGDAHAMAREMVKLATDRHLLASLSENARRGAADLTVNAAADRLATLYESLVAAGLRACGKGRGRHVIFGSIGRTIDNPGPEFSRETTPTSGPVVGLYRGAWGAPALSAADTVASDAASGSWLAFCGNPFWRTTSRTSGGAALQGRAARLLAALSAHGVVALADLDGGFAIAWWDGSSKSLRLIRDRFGAEPLHYAAAASGAVFGSRAHDVARATGRRPEVSSQGLAEFLTYCYLPGNSTLFEGVLRVPAGAVVIMAEERAPVVEAWYRLSYANPWEPNEEDITRRYRQLLEASVVARLDDKTPGVLLSGGMDSSSVLTFARRHRAAEIDTFSFRCAGASFDESVFARELSAVLGTQHAEVEYGEAEALTILDAVTAMDSPFCDIGIEIGTWLLARKAGGSVDYLLTGDGGDELWASHPVYAAQRLMRWYDVMPLPVAVRRGIASTLNLMKDSEHKRGLAVTLKRILPPADVSPALGHFRWRLYQTPTTLPALLTPVAKERMRGCDPLNPVLESFDGYDGPDDGMSKWLYSDYRTASSFYFNRLLLTRHFGLETRMPFYDRELVEFGARIPAHLKLEGIERTKRLFRVAMEGVLPDVINHRKDKLGHSVPFKNWLRSDGPLYRTVAETLESERFRDRGLFEVGTVRTLIEEHRSRRHNHSHRIWALFVLEQWLRRKMD